VAAIVVALGYLTVIPRLGNVLGVAPDKAWLVLTMFGLGALGMMLGAFGSYLGIRRFLNV
jgi:hypothetical protein